MKSIQGYFEGDDRFSRMLIGIDRPESRNPILVSQWVLGKFSTEDSDKLRSKVFPEAKKILEDWLKMK